MTTSEAAADAYTALKNVFDSNIVRIVTYAFIVGMAWQTLRADITNLTNNKADKKDVADALVILTKSINEVSDQVKDLRAISCEKALRDSYCVNHKPK